MDFFTRFTLEKTPQNYFLTYFEALSKHTRPFRLHMKIPTTVPMTRSKIIAVMTAIKTGLIPVPVPGSSVLCSGSGPSKIILNASVPTSFVIINSKLVSR